MTTETLPLPFAVLCRAMTAKLPLINLQLTRLNFSPRFHMR